MPSKTAPPLTCSVCFLSSVGSPKAVRVEHAFQIQKEHSLPATVITGLSHVTLLYLAEGTRTFRSSVATSITFTLRIAT